MERLESSDTGRVVLSALILVLLISLVAYAIPDSAPKRALLRPGLPLLSATGLGQGWGMFAPEPRISSDGQTILTPADPIGERITVDRQTGWDCPPSPLGALAFWATWLTTGAFAALMASVWRDARRARREQGRYRVHAVISVGLTVVGSVMTLYLLLTACLGGWIWTPAPLLLVCGVGLATRSRFWRLSTLVLLASLVPLEANLGHQLQRRGLDFSSTWTLLDRAYDVPNMAPYVAIAVAAGLTIVALPLLARRAVEAG